LALVSAGIASVRMTFVRKERTVGGCVRVRHGSAAWPAPEEFPLVFAAERADNAAMSVRFTSAFHRLCDEIGTVDQVGIEERVAKYTTRSIKKASKAWGLRAAVRCST